MPLSKHHKAKRSFPLAAPPSTLVSKHLIFQKQKHPRGVLFFLEQVTRVELAGNSLGILLSSIFFGYFWRFIHFLCKTPPFLTFLCKILFKISTLKMVQKTDGAKMVQKITPLRRNFFCIFIQLFKAFFKEKFD